MPFMKQGMFVYYALNIGSFFPPPLPSPAPLFLSFPPLPSPHLPPIRWLEKKWLHVTRSMF